MGVGWTLRKPIITGCELEVFDVLPAQPISTENQSEILTEIFLIGSSPKFIRKTSWCNFFVIPTLADFLRSLRNAESDTSRHPDTPTICRASPFTIENL